VAADGRIEGARFWFTLPIETPPPVPDVLDDAAGEPETEAHADPDTDPPHRQQADTHPNTHS
jgi:two-component system sensor histidine kinase KdpD